MTHLLITESPVQDEVPFGGKCQIMTVRTDLIANLSINGNAVRHEVDGVIQHPDRTYARPTSVGPDRFSCA